MYSKIIEWLAHLEEPYLLVWLIPVLALIYFIITRDFVKFEEIPKKERIIFFISRAIIVSLLLIALATPFAIEETTVEFTPEVTVLIDQSKSMDLFSTGEVQEVISYFQNIPEVELTTAYIQTENSTLLGNSILEYMEQDNNIILFSDGQSTAGALLGDIAVHARTLNSTLYALELTQTGDDSWITIEGDEKTLEGVESTFTIKIQNTAGLISGLVSVKVDGQEIFNGNINGEQSFTRTLALGAHTIEAELFAEDFFPENDKYYKVMHAIEKPEIMLITDRGSTLENLLSLYYDVDVGSIVPADLSPYYAVVINDQHSSLLGSKTESISEFVGEGGGMFVVGGQNSFNFGDYEGSVFETMLPVYIAEPEKEEGDMNIVVVIDISGSTSIAVDGVAAVDIEKALALDIINDLDEEHNVGIVAFHSAAFTLFDLDPLEDHTGMEETIASLQYGGGTSIEMGLERAIAMLEYRNGNKNIILITDGITQSPEEAEKSARRANSKGIKIFTVGVGSQTYEDLLESLAEIGEGIYFPADLSNNIEILFGPPKEFEGDEAGLRIIDVNHFITQGVDVAASLVYKNTFTAKDAGRLLVSTNIGDPVLVAGRYGLGRVVAFAGDDGTTYSPAVYTGENTLLLTRTMNWVIGDPTRKQENFVEVEDTFLGESAIIVIKSSTMPQAAGIDFEKTGEDLYQAVFIPEEQGIYSVMDSAFAVNYPREYLQLGVDSSFANIIENTAGKVFKSENLEDLKEEFITKSKKIIIKRNSIAYYFALAALLIYLVEICARRVLKIWLRKRR